MNINTDTLYAEFEAVEHAYLQVCTAVGALYAALSWRGLVQSQTSAADLERAAEYLCEIQRAVVSALEDSATSIRTSQEGDVAARASVGERVLSELHRRVALACAGLKTSKQLFTFLEQVYPEHPCFHPLSSVPSRMNCAVRAVEDLEAALCVGGPWQLAGSANDGAQE